MMPAMPSRTARQTLPVLLLLIALAVSGCSATGDPLDELDLSSPEAILAPPWRRPLPPGPAPREPAPAFAYRA